MLLPSNYTERRGGDPPRTSPAHGRLGQFYFGDLLRKVGQYSTGVDTVVDANAPGRSAHCGDPIHHRDYLLAGDARSNLDREALAAIVVHYSKRADAPPIEECIGE